MPGWIVTLLITMGVSIVRRFGVPFLEQRFPMLTPLLDEILKIVGGKDLPSKEICSAADHYAGCKSSQFQASDAKHE